ncbi:hypothetical protein QBC44DRAFT_324227 [Cladorrhinum sp. PSN332]|nr:hypothetical protein QBC44DRAFT_324227 [Cladorrhinum sp. PSN332]
MAIDLHLRKSILVLLAEHELQKRLRTACIPPDSTGQNFIDHLNVVPSSAVNVNASRALFTIQFDTFMVTRASLDPGTTVGTVDPAGAHTPVAVTTRPTFEVELTFTGAALSLVCRRVNITSSLILPFRDSILAAVTAGGELARFDIGRLASQIGAPSPTFSRFVDLGSSIILQSGTEASPVSRLAPGQEWGLFLDCDSHKSAVEAMLRRPIERARGSMSGNFTASSECRSDAQVDVRLSGIHNINVIRVGIFGVSITIGISVQTSLVPGGIPELQFRSTWGVSHRVVSGPSVPTPDFTSDVLTLATSIMRPSGLDTAINDRAFLSPRPIYAQFRTFGDSILTLTSLTPFGTGSFFLGGTFSPFPSLNTTIPSVQVTPFPSAYTREIGCRNSASFIAPAEAFTNLIPSETATVICSTELISPTPFQFPLQSLGLFNPTTGGVWLPPSQVLAFRALGIPVKVLIRTSRGVRIVNYGIPPDPAFDASGNATNVVLRFRVADCLSRWKAINPRWWIDGPWATTVYNQPRGPLVTSGDGVVRHHEVYSFLTGVTWVKAEVDEVGGGGVVLEGQAGRSIFMASLSGDGGKQIVFPTFEIVGGNVAGGATLSRISGKDMGVGTSNSKSFSRVATLTRGKDVVEHQLTVTVIGGMEAAVVTTSFKDGRVETSLITENGTAEAVKPGQVSGFRGCLRCSWI